METIDPATGTPLPSDAIQRILFLNQKVHVYNIPPLSSTQGKYIAATWTEDPKRHIFTCRMRVLETSIPQPSAPDRIKVDIVLEDPSSGQLFAAAPYTTPAVVEPAVDSSRFFALRVQDPSGRKATLGFGFEERSDSFDFSVGLQEARKALGIETAEERSAAQVSQKKAVKKEEETKKDYSLKEGETITVSFGGSKFGRRERPRAQPEEKGDEAPTNLNSFALPPPPGSSVSKGGGIAPPPPSARGQNTSAEALGFDDGQFGEFA
ncbi:hypothetical protein DL546_008369 [Coniochaeta pulveracea]|uniref:NECAP PHear domain-containing protein n=1 Tax=Coniochaeta pulveracea TaxID=177199 RepID=A0A420YDC7_9PEZI|nr:hypothetical protein DL546_008369 [Coniochaeta pulveracea]